MMEKAAEIGVALLLFTIGLELSRKRLVAFGLQGLKVGILQLFFTMLVTMVLVMVFGLDWRASIVVGAMVALSSTASVARVLTDRSAGFPARADVDGGAHRAGPGHRAAADHRDVSG